MSISADRIQDLRTDYEKAWGVVSKTWLDADASHFKDNGLDSVMRYLTEAEDRNRDYEAALGRVRTELSELRSQIACM